MPDNDTTCHCQETDSACKNEPALDALQRRVAELESTIETLQTLVRTDGLTGLYNQRYFSEALHREVERTQRTGAEFCLIFLDLDHFKRVNDTWGHEAGNLALKHTAMLITQCTRTPDIPCRYGGEEFAILLPGSPVTASVAVAERIRSLLEQSPVTTEAGEIPLTASFGVSAYDKRSQLTQEQVVETADRLLYKAKHEGRNRVCWEPAKVRRAPQVSQDEKDMLFGPSSNNND